MSARLVAQCHQSREQTSRVPVLGLDVRCVNCSRLSSWSYVGQPFDLNEHSEPRPPSGRKYSTAWRPDDPAAEFVEFS